MKEGDLVAFKIHPTIPIWRITKIYKNNWAELTDISDNNILDHAYSEKQINNFGVIIPKKIENWDDIMEAEK